ncbi:MAG: hypothetical protein J7K79_04675, partial [Thermotoga sp.]|nr:hypothetical protein [Thermotoga sp.]
LLVTRATKSTKIKEKTEEVLEEPEAVLEEIPTPEERKEADKRLDALEELLGRIQKEDGGEESLDVEEVLERARGIFESSAEIPDDLTAEEVNLDVEETFKELESKEEYSEEDTRKLVLALKKKIREE